MTGAGTCLPFLLWDSIGERSTRVVEIPLVVMDSALMGTYAATVSGESALRQGLAALSQVERCGGVFTLNAHPNYANSADTWKLVKALLFACRERGAAFMTVAEVAQRWCSLAVKSG